MDKDNRALRVAELSNEAFYGVKGGSAYISGAPHIKHAALRRLFGGLVVDVFDYASKYSPTPTVLDLGAGEGSVTLPFLELGARVTAVDLSDTQLAELSEKCKKYADMLTVRCENANDVANEPGACYDIIVTNSFLHHIPDYLGLIETCLKSLSPHGQLFTFQDPLRYDTVSKSTKALSAFAYLTWRVLRGDVLGGLARRFRRSKGVYLEESVQDNVEYHVVRNGVDQEAICKLAEENGFDCRLTKYFSTQSSLFQPIGTTMGMKNTFSVIARRQEQAFVGAALISKPQ